MLNIAPWYDKDFMWAALAPCYERLSIDRDALEIVNLVYSDSVGLVTDTFHFYLGDSSFDTLQEIPIEKVLLAHFRDADRIPKAQIKDEIRDLLGETGVIDLPSFVKLLEGKGYDGHLSTELPSL